MRRHNLNSRRDKINYINKVRDGQIKVIEPIADIILIHRDQYLSMKTGKEWSREEYIREHGEDVIRPREQ